MAFVKLNCPLIIQYKKDGSNLQLNGGGLSLLGGDALVVALHGLLAGQVSLAGITLVDQELDVHLVGGSGESF